MSRSLSSLLSPNEYNAVLRFVELLYERYPGQIREAMLFGSKARGDSRPGSDIDILIVVDSDDWRLRHAISTVAAGVSLEHDVLIGSLVISLNRWRHMAERHASLYERITAEGVPLSRTATVP